jgi:superoxide dismutase, Fe-Mn family
MKKSYVKLILLSIVLVFGLSSFENKKSSRANDSKASKTIHSNTKSKSLKEKNKTSVADSGFTLPSLPYAYNALEPHIDEKTMRVHHDMHFQAYITKLNKAIENTKFRDSSIEEILKKIKPADAAIRNNGGGYYNHKLFFESLSPKPKLKPEGELLKAIEKDFGSYKAFLEEFSKAANSVFGSGWAWLIKEKNGKLAIVATSNQDNPLMSFAEKKGFPLMAIDVWEHAYYLNYQNKRADYVNAFFSVLNWEYVENRFKQ